MSKKKLIDASFVKTVVEEHVSYEVAIAIPLINKTINKPSSKLKLFK